MPDSTSGQSQARLARAFSLDDHMAKLDKKLVKWLPVFKNALRCLELVIRIIHELLK